jgi:hypothetical protein
MERVKASLDTAAVPSAARGRTPSGRTREELSTVAGRAGGLARSSWEASAYRSGGGDVLCQPPGGNFSSEAWRRGRGRGACQGETPPAKGPGRCSSCAVEGPATARRSTAPVELATVSRRLGAADAEDAGRSTDDPIVREGWFDV